MQKLKIGTCSWKYESWQGLVYPETGDFNYLQEYSKHYDTVEIDQWFWSLFKNNAVVLPKANVVMPCLVHGGSQEREFCLISKAINI